MTFDDAVVSVAVAGFALMGAAALISPATVTRQVELQASSATGRSEIRAVYGGFGLAVAGLLVGTWFWPAARPGIVLAVAVALLGMAGGRLASAAVDRSLPRGAALYLVIELVGGTGLMTVV